MLSSFSFFCKQTRIKNGFSIRAFLPLFLFESVAAAAAGGAAAGIAAAALFGFFACQGCCDDVEYGIYEVIEILFRNVQIRTGRADNNMLVHFKGTEDLIGQMVPVKITENKTFYLIGERM